MFNVSSINTWFGLIFSVTFCLACNTGFTMEPSNVLCIAQSIAIPLLLNIIHCLVLLKALRLRISFCGFPHIFGINTHFLKVEVVITLFLAAIGLGVMPALVPMLSSKGGMDLFKKEVFHKLTTGEEFLVYSCINFKPVLIFVYPVFIAFLTLVVMFKSRNIPNVYEEPWDIMSFSLFSLVCHVLYLAGWYGYDTTRAMEYFQEVTCGIFLLAVCFMALFNLFWRKIYYTLKGWTEPYQVPNNRGVDRSQSFTSARCHETVIGGLNNDPPERPSTPPMSIGSPMKKTYLSDEV